MSVPTYQQAVAEENERIATAIEENDAATLYILANNYAEQGDDEMAFHLLTKARRAQRNEWAYDEAVDNALCS